ncbi:acyl transferase/acyl hydrolase/lysophospholipase [Diplogelasinospora grovesii]|uniref:Acyl transferase/acyl hydrolase/lysophospholipase n=1 Tax=Diplogelasinospora grovesii TaxID=303347 RepID=A0AAN6RZM3_9PEZI|nr:acyl transferase/acyl hydrolase/lysophospholipase [Diplogelasinospora grovesii]
MPGNGLHLLALDGGGVRGLSSLMILRRLMATVDPDAPPKPYDYFDMIGGTSTGGLIAIMLGRLRMTVNECIDAYTTLSDRVFEKKSHRVDIKGKLQGRFDSAELKHAVRNILISRGLREDALLKDPNSPYKVDTICLTNYCSPRSDNSNLLNATTIWQACRVTSATITFFDPITIGPFNEQFVDRALSMNNPGGQLRGSLKCLVSISTSIPALKPVRDDTEKTAQQFYRDKSDLDDKGRYYQFNVNHGLEEIRLKESKKKTEITATTRRYIKAYVNNIARREC